MAGAGSCANGRQFLLDLLEARPFAFVERVAVAGSMDDAQRQGDVAKLIGGALVANGAVEGVDRVLAVALGLRYGVVRELAQGMVYAAALVAPWPRPMPSGNVLADEIEAEPDLLELVIGHDALWPNLPADPVSPSDLDEPARIGLCQTRLERHGISNRIELSAGVIRPLHLVAFPPSTGVATDVP
jgi:hypothetical protein